MKVTRVFFSYGKTLFLPNVLRCVFFTFICLIKTRMQINFFILYFIKNRNSCNQKRFFLRVENSIFFMYIKWIKQYSSSWCINAWYRFIFQSFEIYRTKRILVELKYICTNDQWRLNICSILFSFFLYFFRVFFLKNYIIFVHVTFECGLFEDIIHQKLIRSSF